MSSPITHYPLPDNWGAVFRMETNELEPIDNELAEIIVSTPGAFYTGQHSIKITDLEKESSKSYVFYAGNPGSYFSIWLPNKTKSYTIKHNAIFDTVQKIMQEKGAKEPPNCFKINIKKNQSQDNPKNRYIPPYRVTFGVDYIEGLHCPNSSERSFITNTCQTALKSSLCFLGHYLPCLKVPEKPKDQ